MSPPEDIRLSFNEAVETYDRVRPSYPVGLFDALFRMLPAEPEIVEVGPGTGQVTTDLLARGASVQLSRSTYGTGRPTPVLHSQPVRLSTQQSVTSWKRIAASPMLQHATTTGTRPTTQPTTGC